MNRDVTRTIVVANRLKTARRASSSTIGSVDIHAPGPGAEGEPDRRELSLAVPLPMDGLGFDVDEVAGRGLDGPVPERSRVDVDRARQGVSDNVMVSVVMPGSPAMGGSPRCTAMANPSRSMAERSLGISDFDTCMTPTVGPSRPRAPRLRARAWASRRGYVSPSRLAEGR